MAVANAHSLGARPFQREDYIRKFKTLTADAIDANESDRFLSAAQSLPELNAAQLGDLNVQVGPEKMPLRARDTRGIF
jgi:2-methylcitrate dehydratase